MPNKKVSAEQLGMSRGSAWHKLRWLVLFDCAQELGRLQACYRCGKSITNVDELSFDHVKNWLHSDNPAERFFDINNVEFSHRLCNTAAALQGRRRGSVLQRSSGRWRSSINLGEGNVHLGTFDTPEEAEKAIQIYLDQKP